MIDFTRFKNNRTLMIQGCSSDAGKSLLTAGIGRVMANHGRSVAPFKPQNMALNSAVTLDGGEIGRAQALQAIACRTPSLRDMNPILLKPNSDVGAQIIVRGSVRGNMSAQEFHAFKREALTEVMAAYQGLQQQFDWMVVEGAGSPAEINLREHDIANMGFAEAADCPVILVADIDRGGVFAQIVGTLELLSAFECARVVGFVINKFRGDLALLSSGLTWLEQKTGKPVLGVLDYLLDLQLDEEDAINNSQSLGDSTEQVLNVIVPVLPRISNHTDFDALRLHPNVNFEFVALDRPLPPADLIIVPGSKNVINDLIALQDAGWQKSLLRHLRYGGKVLGICGGFQMLGLEVHDPFNVESQQSSAQGFGFLNISTTLQKEKTLLKRKGQISLNVDRATIEGYEIHCGHSSTTGGSNPWLTFTDDFETGVASDLSADQQVAGCYLHGLFDSPEATEQILQWAGLNTAPAININEHREQQLERWAKHLESRLSNQFWTALGVELR